jgi:hypothetical protein
MSTLHLNLKPKPVAAATPAADALSKRSSADAQEQLRVLMQKDEAFQQKIDAARRAIIALDNYRST